MSFFVFAWIASVLYGGVVILSKLTSKHTIKNPWLLTFLWSLSVLTFTALTAVSNGVGMPKAWNYIFLMGISNSIVWILFVLALYKLDASVISPLYNFRTPITVILSGLILGEIMTQRQYALILLVVFAGLFVAYDERFKLRAFFQKGVAISLIAIFFSSVNATFTKPAITQNGYWEATLWSAVATQLFLLATIPKFIKNIRLITLKQVGACVLIAGVETLGIFAQNRAYSANVGISTTIINLPLSMVMAFLFSRFAPKLLEHHPVKVYLVRFIAAGVMVATALQLSK